MTGLCSTNRRTYKNSSHHVWPSNNTQQLFKQWNLRLSSTKTTTSLFHLDNHQAHQVLQLNIDNKPLSPEPYPK